MARPFRYQPPLPNGELLHRQRLLARLDQRWNRRLVTVVAGPGFGKTSLLVQAMTANVAGTPAVTAHHRDIWLSCEPGDESAGSLLRALRQACGVRPTGGLASLCASVWAQAPDQVCFILDDVHEIPPHSEGLGLLGQLLTDLPLNGHGVLASREPIPLRIARLGARNELVRVTEGDLLFDDAEVDDFAAVRGMAPSLCAASGGWPALAELLASAGADLVFEYLWDEVLNRIGEHRARNVALFQAVGGGDDDIAKAVSNGEFDVARLVARLPLVARSAHGAVIHPLWVPPLRPLVSADEVNAARISAAAAHRRAGRASLAIELTLDAEAWDDALEALRNLALEQALTGAPGEFGRWFRSLPASHRSSPEAMLAIGLDERSRDPVRSYTALSAAAAGFATKGDTDGEIAAIADEGIVRWWANDADGIFALLARVQQLADGGSVRAAALLSVGTAAIAQVTGDADGVFSALDGIDDVIAPDWLPAVYWLRSVAHRQRGQLTEAYTTLDDVAPDGVDEQLNQFDLARWRTDWLAGDVESVCTHLAELAERYRAGTERFFYVQTTSERAAHEAWLGRSEVAEQLLASTQNEASSMPGSLQHVLRCIAASAVAVDRGDEVLAATIIRRERATTLASTDRWYWRDRGALALDHVLGEESSAWAQDAAAGPAHRDGVALARALRAVRCGDPTPVAQLSWPACGVVRAQLPHRWVLELCTAAVAAGNPPPRELLERFGGEIHRMAQQLAAGAPDQARRTAASLAVAATPSTPAYRIAINVVGPLEFRRDGIVVSHPHLRRQRVRELLSILVVRRRVRREQVSAALWPDHSDPAHNLRVTLSYLQQLLQPERPLTDLPYFVRADGGWLVLADNANISVDLWLLEANLDAGARADQEGDPVGTTEHFARALPLWRGEPLGDLPDSEQFLGERTRLQSRYADAAVRTGELQLAAGRPREAIRSAAHAISADVCNEAAYRVMIRARIDLGDLAGARRTLAECVVALATLDLTPDAATIRLVETAATAPT